MRLHHLTHDNLLYLENYILTTPKHTHTPQKQRSDKMQMSPCSVSSSAKSVAALRPQSRREALGCGQEMDCPLARGPDSNRATPQ